MNDLLAILLISASWLIGMAVGGWASWVDAKRSVKAGLVDWKKEEVEQK